jgi:hypothetical protein
MAKAQRKNIGGYDTDFTYLAKGFLPLGDQENSASLKFQSLRVSQ